MDSLEARLREVMDACNWQQADLVKISRQSKSVVSQWLGGSSKAIKTIGKLEAAIYIERESGFSALWVAKGMGPKRARPADSSSSVRHAAEPPAQYIVAQDVLRSLARLLSGLPVERRQAAAVNLQGLANDGGAEHWIQALVPIFTQPEKLPAAA